MARRAPGRHRRERAGAGGADVDGDGRLELIAGCSWYRLLSSGEWERQVYTEEVGGPRVVAIAYLGPILIPVTKS